MSIKRKSYSADFKAILVLEVLEVLEGEKTINEIVSAYEGELEKLEKAVFRKYVTCI